MMGEPVDYWLVAAHRMLDRLSNGEAVPSDHLVNLLPGDMLPAFQSHERELDDRMEREWSATPVYSSETLITHRGIINGFMQRVVAFANLPDSRQNDRARGGLVMDSWWVRELWNRLPDEDKAHCMPLVKSAAARYWHPEVRDVMQGMERVEWVQSEGDRMGGWEGARGGLARKWLEYAIKRHVAQTPP